MSDVCKAELYVLVDAAGDYAVGKDEQTARENYESEIQALADADGFRLVKIVVNVPLPAIAELTGDAPAQGAAALASLAAVA